MAAKLRILVDLNVIMDVVQRRQPHYEDSARVLDAVARDKVSGFLAAHSLTTLFYVVNRVRSREVAVTTLTELLEVFSVAAVDDTVIRKAISWGWADFEDAVQMAAALGAGADYLVTRNSRDFRDGLVSVIEPAAFLAVLMQG